MSLTIKRLKGILNSLDENAIIHDEQNQEFIHAIASDTLLLSITKPIGTCNRTGSYVYPSIIKGYSAFCPELDEDLYEMEWTPIQKC